MLAGDEAVDAEGTCPCPQAMKQWMPKIDDLSVDVIVTIRAS